MFVQYVYKMVLCWLALLCQQNMTYDIFTVGGEDTGLDTCFFHRTELSMEHRSAEQISIKVTDHDEACYLFVLRLQ